MSSHAPPIVPDARHYAIEQLSRSIPDVVFSFGCFSDIEDVRELEHIEFSRSGYTAHRKHSWSPYYRDRFDRIPETHLLLARRKSTNQLIGTLSVTIDGPDGLLSDIDFPCETEALRLNTRHLAQVWRFAVDSEFRKSARVAHGLMSLAHFSDFALSISSVVATIHPKHLDFYRMLGYEPIAYRPCVSGLVSAPAILIGIVEPRFILRDEHPWEHDVRPLIELAA